MRDEDAPEEWRIIADFPDYEVSDLGRVRRATDAVWASRGCKRIRAPAGYVLTPCPARGYLQARLSVGGRVFSVGIHVLVCEAFQGPRPSPLHEAAHGDGTRTNNRNSNLRWATRKENMADRDRHGRTKRGAAHSRPLRLLSENDILEIREMLRAGERQRVIASRFEISQSTVSLIKTGTNWGWLP
jgi:hypothetical protein